jgi:hypothetical protein
MLRTLSYANIVFAVVYFLAFLLNSMSYAIAGVLLTVIFNFMVIRILERGGRFNLITYVVGTMCLIFAGFLILWLSHIISSSIAHHYFRNSWFYISLTSLFAISIILQFLLICLRKQEI